MLTADAIIIADGGNAERGLPTLTTSLRGMVTAILRVDSMTGMQHSGSYGGAAPDALAALIAILASFRDAEGRTTVRGLEDLTDATWTGVDYPAERFRADAGVLDGVQLIGGGSVPDAVWARPALTVTGIDSRARRRLGQRDPAVRRGPAEPAHPAERRHRPSREGSDRARAR